MLTIFCIFAPAKTENEMEIKELQALYARHPQVRTLARALQKDDMRTIRLSGLQASSAALAFAALGVERSTPFLFVLDDLEEAGYFYHDLVQIMGESAVLFFPSSFRRAVRFGQRDAASEILRTEVLGRLMIDDLGLVNTGGLYIVSYPEAVAERVVSQKTLDERTLQLRTGERVDISFVEQTLLEFGFQRTDYVYEPGQFAVRGSLVDVFSYSCEYPFRIDFFGDEVDSIRTFEVESQLSRERQEVITLVPELSGQQEDRVPLSTLLPENTVLVAKDLAYVTERIGQIWQEGFSQQAKIEENEVVKNDRAKGDEYKSLSKERLLIDAQTFEQGFTSFKRVELSSSHTHSAPSVITFSTSAQPIFHKNFDLLTSAFEDYLSKGYRIYILADSAKQTDRLKAIFEERSEEFSSSNHHASPEKPSLPFTPVSKTLHAGFADNTLKVCFFTDHQIFDRFHKYNLRSDRARGGKVALSLKELQEFEVGDYVVHVDHGIGRFGGLVRREGGDYACQMQNWLFSF